MRTLILYYSKTGNTQKYAEDIAASLKCDVMPLKKFKKKMIADYDTIIFGSRIMGSKIQKIDDFLSHYDAMEGKNVIVFAVGMSVVTAQTRKDLISANILDLYHLRFYQLRGSFEYDKLSFWEKFLMNQSLRRIAAMEDASADQKFLLTITENPIIYYDNQGVDKIISVVRRLETEVPTA